MCQALDQPLDETDRSLLYVINVFVLGRHYYNTSKKSNTQHYHEFLAHQCEEGFRETFLRGLGKGCGLGCLGPEDNKEHRKVAMRADPSVTKEGRNKKQVHQEREKLAVVKAVFCHIESAPSLVWMGQACPTLLSSPIIASLPSPGHLS